MEPEACELEDRAGTGVGSGPLRPVDGPDARHAVLEAVSPEAGHVIVHYLHLAAAESWVLKEMQFVIRAILGARPWRARPWDELVAPTPRTEGLGGSSKGSRHHRVMPTPRAGLLRTSRAREP